MSSIKRDPNFDPRKIEWGEPAPDWLRYAETYLAGLDWAQVKTGRVPFVTHVPPNAEVYRELRALGVRAIPYIQFLHLPMYAPVFGIDLRRHTDWIAVDAKGERVRTRFWQSADMKNWYITCPRAPGYVDALERWVRRQMHLGASGVFVDCVGAAPPCHGARLGLHRHTIEDGELIQEDIFRHIRRAIKECDPHGALLGNGDPTSSRFPRNLIRYVDAFMQESYICTFVRTERWFDWHRCWNALGKRMAPAMQKGKQLQALSYLGTTRNPLKDDAFFCYATARLATFVWGGGGLVGNPASVLHSTRLGRPLSDQRATGGVHFRLFEDGFVAVNPTDRKRALVLRDGLRSGKLHDLYAARTLQATDGAVRLSIPPQSGRVYLYLPEIAEKNPMSLDDLVPERQATLGPAHVLRIETRPAIGNARFRVDGIEYATRAGCQKAKWWDGALCGKIEILFNKAGAHTVEFLGPDASALTAPSDAWKRYYAPEVIRNVRETLRAKNMRLARWLTPRPKPAGPIRVPVSGQTVITAVIDLPNAGGTESAKRTASVFAR